MSSLEKRHTGQRGSMQGHRKYSDGFSDTSSSGSCMDDTDREVSNLTDRAFRSLCIGEEAIYNDSEFSSSPTERYKAFAEETQQKTAPQEAFSYSIQQYGETEAQPEMASTFQHSYVDVTHQEQAFREGSLSYTNNGSNEVMWQQGRSSSRVSSLIKAFSSGECYRDSGTCDVILARDRYRDFGSESWDKSALISIQRELSEFSGYNQNYKSGPYQSYRNHFYASEVATGVAQTDATVLMKSKFKALNSTNCFFHSEFSPFQLWEEYSKFAFESTNVSGFMSANEFPRWYDSPIYKELKDNHRVPNSQCESRRFSQRQIQDVMAGQRSRSTVIQKASAIEKRCESEIASNYPPWKKNNNFVWNKLPVIRPATVSPTNEKTCRPDSNLFSNNKATHEILVESTLPNSVTPFNITQLLTPVIHTRQETETSEILQFAHTPSVSDYSSQGEADPKLQTDVKHLRDSYKSKASSLLFNLKDNRKRVKSTYSPTRFKGLEITDRNKQPSKLEGRESRFSDILVSQETAQEILTGTDARASCNLTREPSAAPITLKDYTDGFVSYDNSTLTSPQIQDGVANYKSAHGSSEGHSSSRDPLANVELSAHHLSAQDKSSLTSEGQLQDLNCTFSPTRPKIANMLPKAYPLTHSLPAQSQSDIQQRKDCGRKTFIDYSQNETVKERCPWDKFGSVKESDSRLESGPFRGEIAALIEMDKQRKATAKQYSSNDSYSVRKETYMQKVNEDIKLGRLSKEEAPREFREDTISPRKTSYSDKYGGLHSFNVKNDLVKEAPEQNVPSYSTAKQNAFDQRAYAPLQGQKTEELYSHQPYKYEPNKQWHMATTHEDRHAKESLWMQNQISKISKISNATEFSYPNPGLQDKDSILPTDTSDHNDITKQEDRFSINDILAIRDNEQARKLKDSPFITPKSENSQNEVQFNAAEKLTITDPGHEVQDSISPSPGSIRKDTNISYDRKDRIMSKDTDKVTTRAFSHKERGQSKQEILTSKLKAHAQKEISAIKEKGLAKQGILARNTTKSSVAISNDGQEGHPVKKEITADKLNHLFQDITYSSVTQYKELYKAHSGSPPSIEKQPLHFEDNQNAGFEKRDERVKYIPLAVERQDDKHPADDNVLMKERGTIVSGMRNNAQPSRIGEDKQVSVTSSEDINTNKESAKQSQELLSGHLTAAVKTEKYTCQNPLALHEEKQTFQHDQNERSSQSNYTCSEKATTKKDLHFTSKEASKSNSGLNKDSHLELERNAPRVEEVNVHHKSKIDAAVEQPKNEPIKNSSGITASQLTTSSSDMKFKNGNPPAKTLMEPAKSKLTSNLQPVTLSADAEHLINRTYISSDSEASLMEITPRVSQRTREPETLKCINNENGQALMVKNNVLENQQNNTSPEKAVETNTGNQMMDGRSKLTNKETPTQKTSAKDKETHQQKELRDDENTKSELSRSQNLSRMKDVSKQGEKRAESVKPKQKEPSGPLDMRENNNAKSTKESQEIDLSKSEPKKAEDELQPIVSSQSKVIVDEVATQKDNTQKVEPAVDTSSISLTSSKEEPEEEPMIYKICVSSKTEAASDDEPMIFSIFVSSKCHIDEPQNSESSVGTERCLKDEGFCIENDRAENEHEVVCRKTEASSNVEEKDEKIGKCEPPSTTDKSNVMGRITTSYEDLLAKYGLPVSDHHSHFTSKHTQEERERKQKEETVKHGTNKPQKISENTQTRSDDSRQASSQEASNISQPLKEAESKMKQLRDVPSITSHSKSDVSVIPKDRNTQTIEPSMESRVRDIQSKEKKVEEQVRNSESMQSLRKTGSITDDKSNYTKSAKKTENVSLTGKQSGESTRAAITDVLKTPISNTSMAKDVANTKLNESKNPRRIIPQPEKKLEEVEGKNKMFNHTDTSMLHGRDIFSSENQKSIHEAKQQDSTMALKQESFSHKDAQKVDEQVRNSESMQSLRKTGNITDDVSNYTKSAKKTENVSLMAKQSAIGESTRATITDVLQTPISNTSMAKDVANTKLIESKNPRRIIPQPEQKLEEVQGKNKMFNHTDTSMLHGRDIFSSENQKSIHEAKQQDSTMALKQESVSHKDAQKVEEQVRNSESVQSLRKTGNITDDVSNYTKSANKTENVSLMAKQSAIGESTRATITDVLQTPISNTSMAKDVANTKLTESKNPRRIIPQPEEVEGKHKMFNTSMPHVNKIHEREIVNSENQKSIHEAKQHSTMALKQESVLHKDAQKVEEQVRNSESMQSLRKTGNITDDVSNYTKSTKKTENASLTAKQSAIGESTRATITDVLQTPISNISMAKDVANTKLIESKNPRRIIPQPEEVDGKNKMFNHTDTSMPHGRDIFNSENQKSIHEAKQQDSTMALKQESFSHKDAQKVEKQVRNSESVQSLRKTGNITDDVSNYTKSTKKTENASLTAKQSAIGESTRARITDVLKTPISNTSMAKDVANTKLNESKNPRRIIPQPEEVEGKNKMVNPTDTSMPHGRDIFNSENQKSIHEAKQQDSTMALKQESVSHKDAQKVEEQVRNSESVQSLGKTGNIIDNLSNYTKSTKKTENVSLTAKQSAIGESTRATITDVVKTPISNTSMAKDVANTKLTESKNPRRIIPQPEEVEGKSKMFNHTDTSMPHVNKIHGRDIFNSEKQKSIHEAKQQDSTIALKQESVSHKNGKGDLEAKRLQVELNKSHEITNRMKMASKDGAATHVNNYKDKASRIGEDVCAVVKQDQAPFEAPKIHLEDIKVSTEEVSSNKEFMVGHKNQHEVIKRENLQGKKDAVVTEHVGEKDFSQQKNLPIAQNEPKTVDRVKGLGEMASKPLKRDCPSESKKTEINLREEAVQTQEKTVGDNKQPALNGDKRKKEDPVLSQNGQKDGDSKVNENRSSLGGKKKGHVEATETRKADQPNTNQYHPGRSFVPETERSVSYEKEHTQLSQKDSKKEHVLSKSEATQSNKKVTRPEISAIADYARLKVIAAEDDVKELDIFPKIDFYNNYAQPALKISKDSHGHMSSGESKRETISKEKHNPSMSIAEPKPVSLVASGSQDGAASTQPRTPANHKESNTKQTLEHPKRENTVPLQATINRSRQPTNDKITAKNNFSHSGRQESLANLPLSSNVKAGGNQINTASPPGEEMEELQYYTVNALDVEPKPNNTPEPPSVCLKMSQNKSEEEKKEDSLSLTDYGTVHSTRSQSNSSSPAMGKPTMFRVKDNTMRPSSVTKTVKPRFHRSFSDDFRIGSPKEHLSGSEKDDETHSYEPAIASQTLQKVKETLNNNFSSAEYATKQSKSYQRRSQHFEEEETCSVISTMSEDMENCSVRPTGLADLSMAFMHRNETYRDSYQRPASACYERPESVCYERPESACSDMRSFGKPPTVPPKSEKALRRAQRLTTRRLKKTETPKIAPENQEQPESKSISNVSSVPPSPSDILPTHQAVQASPPLSQYDIQPNYTPPAHSVLAQPFPMTQRKLLQDPNSGQYFMVDVPLPVKTKTFYDPETGKYVQLNVRQRSQGAVTQPASVEMLNAPYMLYRGYLPMAASSLSALRSEMSTPPALTVHQDTLETGNESWRQNVHHRDPQQYPEILYGSHEQIHNPALNAENSFSDSERRRDIITMSELEDFAMEST